VQEQIRACFPKQARLLKPGEFGKVFKSRNIRSSDAAFVFLAIPNQQEHPRLGFAIAKKSTRRAVDRNRLKRLVRESFRQHKLKLPDCDIVVMAKPQAKTMNNAELFQSIARHWHYLSKKCAN